MPDRPRQMRAADESARDKERESRLDDWVLSTFITVGGLFAAAGIYMAAQGLGVWGSLRAVGALALLVGLTWIVKRALFGGGAPDA